LVPFELFQSAPWKALKDCHICEGTGIDAARLAIWKSSHLQPLSTVINSRNIRKLKRARLRTWLIAAGSLAAAIVLGLLIVSDALGGEPSVRLFNGIRQVESHGNDYAVGDHGQARGPYQIHAAYWRDACRFGGVRWSYARWVWDRRHCQQVMAWYWQAHHARSDQARARMHNGGPGGVRSPAARAYWRRVQRSMNPRH
jgi:hypothetical protein